MGKLAQYELKMLLEKCNKTCNWPDRLLADNIIRSEDGNKLDFNNYRKQYYIKKFNMPYCDDDDKILEKQIKTICEDYIEGLTFVLRYYFKSIPTFGWNYPHHYAPFLCDLAKYATKIDFNIEFVNQPPLNIYESLFGILPMTSFNLLPSEVTDGIGSKIRLDPSFLTEFETDLDGKMYEYEGICLLPLLTYDKIKDYFKNVKLTDDQKDKLIRRAKLYVF
jgi:5'-3' exoribonuclease 1